MSDLNHPAWPFEITKNTRHSLTSIHNGNAHAPTIVVLAQQVMLDFYPLAPFHIYSRTLLLPFHRTRSSPAIFLAYLASKYSKSLQVHLSSKHIVSPVYLLTIPVVLPFVSVSMGTGPSEMHRSGYGSNLLCSIGRCPLLLLIVPEGGSGQITPSRPMIH